MIWFKLEQEVMFGFGVETIVFLFMVGRFGAVLNQYIAKH